MKLLPCNLSMARGVNVRGSMKTVAKGECEINGARLPQHKPSRVYSITTHKLQSRKFRKIGKDAKGKSRKLVTLLRFHV